jgi:bifunctional DNA-binding transcriptional regulator/antitoxin component of YhaV-PrlF toxin-antitoxin module
MTIRFAGPAQEIDALTEPESATVAVSKNGGVPIPDRIRQRRGWAAGTRLIAEETPEGVLLKDGKPLKVPSPFAPTRPEDAHGMLAYTGSRK